MYTRAFPEDTDKQRPTERASPDQIVTPTLHGLAFRRELHRLSVGQVMLLGSSRPRPLLWSERLVCEICEVLFMFLV